MTTSRTVRGNVHGRVLRHDGKMPGDRPPVHCGHGLPIEKHAAGLRFQGAVQASQEGTLAGTVRTEEAGDKAGVRSSRLTS